MPQAGFKPVITSSERLQTLALGRNTTGVGSIRIALNVFLTVHHELTIQ